MIRSKLEYLWWSLVIIFQWSLAIGFSVIAKEIYWFNFSFAIIVTVCVVAGFILRERHRREHQKGFTTTVTSSPQPIFNSSAPGLFRKLIQSNFPNPYAAFSDNKPAPKVVEEDTPYYGWRSYGLEEDGILQGSVVAWPEREMQAECKFQHNKYAEDTIKSILQDDVAFEFWKERQRYAGVNAARQKCLEHLENNSCPDGNGCGIWGRAEPQDALVVAHCMAFGTVVLDDENNWRASDVRIEALFINKSLIYHYLLNGSSLPILVNYIDYEKMALDLSQRYGVPVEAVESTDHLRSKVTTLPALT